MISKKEVYNSKSQFKPGVPNPNRLVGQVKIYWTEMGRTYENKQQTFQNILLFYN